MRACRRVVLFRAVSVLLASMMLVTSAASPAVAAVETTQPPLALAEAEAPQPVMPTTASPAERPTTSPAPESIPPGAVEIPEKRTANAEHYRLPDGRYFARVSPSAIHHRDDRGRWADIDPTLVSDAATGRMRTASTPLTVSFDAQSVRGPVEITSDSWRVAIDYLGAAEPRPFTLGNQARYETVRAATDVVYEALGSGVKETVVLESATAPNSFDFFLSMEGLNLRQDGSGRWILARPGEFGAELALGELIVEDSSSGLDGEPARCTEATSVVTPVSGGAWVRVIVPRAWLDDPMRVFPVKVDPTVAPDAYTDTFVSSKFATNYSASTELKVGYYDSTTGYNRALVKVDLSSVPQGADIVDAYYHMYQFHTYYVSAATTTHLARATSPWSASSVRWASKPAYQYLESMRYGGRGVHVYWRGANMLGAIKDWIANPAINYGFMSYQSEGGSENTVCWRKFYSCDHSLTSVRPDIGVTYQIPAISTGGYDPSYRVDETVSVSVSVASLFPGEVKEVHLLPNYTTGQPARYNGYLKWSASLPAADWSATPLPTGGYLCEYVGSSPAAQDYGRQHIQAIPELCSVQDQLGQMRTVTFAFRPTAEFDLSAPTTMDSCYVSSTGAPAWRTGDSAVGFLPGPVEASVAAVRGLAWHTETDGGSTADTGTAGRGVVDLSWPSAGQTATGYRVYLHDGNAWRSVATTVGTSWTSSGAGLYPGDLAIASMSAGTMGNPYLSGSGLDLRDDPTPLYAKTAGTALDAFPGYLLKVAPYNGTGEVQLSDCPTVTVQLPKRTRYVNEPPADTSADLGEIAGHAAAAVLDSGTVDPARLELSTTDLSVSSWGPVAALSRTYRSDATSTTMFAPGWRFGFEQRIDTDGSDAVWTDADGGKMRFVSLGAGAYRAPRSVVATLTRTPPDVGSWALELKGGTVLRFDPQGRLLSEADREGRVVSYDRSVADVLTITAANAQTMTVTLDGGGVTSARYLDREVHYAFDQGGSVATVTIDPHASTSKTLAYSYDTNERLSGLRVGEVPSAAWGLAYADDPAVSRIEYPGYAGDDHRRGDLTYGGDSAVFTRYGEVDGAADTAIATTYRWSPTGAMLERSNPGTTTAVWGYEYNAVGEQLLERSPLGRVTSAMTDLRGNVVRSVDEGGRVTTTVYDPYDDAIQETDPRGSTTYRTYTEGRLASEEKTLDAAGRHSRTEYTYQASSPWLMTSKRSQIDTDRWAATEYSDFAPNGEPRTVTEVGVKLSATGTPVNLDTTRLYDDAGRLVSETDARGVRVTSQTVDVAGRVTESQDATGVVTHTRYDALGNATESWRSHEASPGARLDRKVTEYGGESRVLLETIKDSVGDTVATITRTYDPLGREISSDNSAVGGTNVTRYDAAGNATRVWAEGSNLTRDDASTRTAVNADSQTTSELQPAATTSATVPVYNPDTSVASQTEPDGSSVEFDYQADGDLESEASPSDAGTATTTYTTDLDGQTISQKEPDQAVVTYSYDLMGRLVSSGVVGQQMSTKLYNTLGWVLEETDFDGIRKTREYDEAGRVIIETIGGQRTEHGYDEMGREISRVNPDGSSITWTRDVFGRMTQEVHRGTNSATARDTTTAYDVAGRVSSTSDAVSGLARTYAYDPSGAVTLTETRPGGRTVTYGMHSTGLLTSINAEIAGRSVDWSVTATDAAGRVTNAQSSTFVNQWSLVYDQAGRPVRPASAAGWNHGHWGLYEWLVESQVVPGSGPDGSVYGYSPTTGKKTRDSLGFNAGREETAYTYDITGRLASATRNGGATTYAYEAASGAISGYKRPNESTTTLTYDAVSGHLSAVGTKRYSYDALGRRDWAGSSTNPSETAYAWSGERLTGVTSQGRSSAFVYDAAGQRTRSVVTSASVTTTTTWAYDGLRLLGLAAEVSDGTTYTLDYLYDERGVVFAGVYGATETTAVPFLMVTTDRGDVRELLDEGGAGFAHYYYDAYGVQSGILGAATSRVDTATVTAIASRQPLRYASYTFDEQSGLYYCSQRYYDPGVAAFISKDPARADGEESAYQYCGGDPVGKTDPSGEWDGDVDHWGWTYAAALAVWRDGLYATFAANGARAQDDVPDGYWGPNWGAHFNTRLGASRANWIRRFVAGLAKADSRRDYFRRMRAEAVALARRGRRPEALRKLGMGLHALQDSWAHGNATERLHLESNALYKAWEIHRDVANVKGLAPPSRFDWLDNPRWRPQRAAKAKSQTLREIRSFKAQVGRRW